MSKQRKGRPRVMKNPAARARIWMGAALIVTGAAMAWMKFGHTPQSAARPVTYQPHPKGTVTFNRHIAPILFSECAGCHRPGGAGPFALLAYADVRKRARQIVKVTRSHYMPPWLPEAGHLPFADERRLSIEQLGLIEQWTSDGTPEGAAADLPARPQWAEGWELGTPDLVVTMPETYALPADGKDVYRNFIVPVPTTGHRFVRAMEFRPDSRAVHHAFIRLDRTGQARRADALEPGPGFGGMGIPSGVESPGGHFLSWQPGRRPAPVPRGLAWPLPAGTDLVVQMHLQPTGKPEPIRASIGFHFTDEVPTNTPMKIGLTSYAIDLPPGVTNQAAEDGYTLPVDVELLAVLPHTHYLGRRIEGTAALPDGTRKPLLVIPEWDFNWQSDFRYAPPVFLPKGTTVSMRFAFDNSTNNARNPHHPPQRVRFGMQSSDEMAELWLQVLARTDADLEKLMADHDRKSVRDIITYNQILLERDPLDARAHTQLAKALLSRRQREEAHAHLRRAVEIEPENDDAHYHLGVLALEGQQLVEAEQEFMVAARLNPGNAKARNNAGLACLRQGKLDEAAAHFQEALRLNPEDAFARRNLGAVQQAKTAGRGNK